MDPLSSNPFLEGWRSLPDELRLHVLRYAVHVEGSLLSHSFEEESYVRNKVADHIKRVLYPLLSVPEIRPLVIEAFYTQTKTAIMHDTGGSTGLKDIIQLPPLHIRPYIRHLEVFIMDSSPRTFKFLAEMADGTLGFTNLRSVFIAINGGPHDRLSGIQQGRKNFQAYLAGMDKIELATRSLEVEYRHDKENHMGTDPMEMVVLDKIGLKGAQEKVENKLFRYYWDKKPETVESWPVGNTDQFRKRVTKTIMFVR